MDGRDTGVSDSKVVVVNVMNKPEVMGNHRNRRRSTDTDEGVKAMNEPLKHKLFSVYGQLLNKKILLEAWKKVKSNRGSGGVDGETIKSFEEHLDENIEELLQSLKDRTYKCKPVRRVYIPKKNGKLRPLGIPTIKDRIVQQALVMRLEPFFEENVFHDSSCGFRPNRDAELAIKKVMWNLETGYVYIYDFDIKGYFDNIPHKKLMKVLNKYISDGTVLQMIWQSLKAGYMEDEIVYETPKGQMQGGVHSPLIANAYLNELDWELDKAGHRHVRYADDAIVMCKTPEELEQAKATVKRVMDELGLELAEDKTHDVDFHDDDFDYLNFTFHHLRDNKKAGHVTYWVAPSKSALKKFKSDIKAKTHKTLSKSFEQWAKELNPVLRGKFNYFLICNRACKAVRAECLKRGMTCKATAFKGYDDLDGYVRQRLRVNFGNRGKRHAKVKDGKMLNVKFPNNFFLLIMKLTSGAYLAEKIRHEDLTLEQYSAQQKMKKKRKFINDERTNRFFKFAYAR